MVIPSTHNTACLIYQCRIPFQHAQHITVDFKCLVICFVFIMLRLFWQPKLYKNMYTRSVTPPLSLLFHSHFCLFLLHSFIYIRIDSFGLCCLFPACFAHMNRCMHICLFPFLSFMKAYTLQILFVLCFLFFLLNMYSGSCSILVLLSPP